MFSYQGPQTYISIGFQEPINKDTVNLKDLQQGLLYVALNELPLKGLDVPSNWKVYPQTPMSSFTEGVQIQAYENGRLRVSISTKFFAIYGRQHVEHPIMDKAADEGTYLQVRRDIDGIIKIDMPLVFQ